MPKITSESNELVSKFFKSNEFFPIIVKFGEEEIKITKRPRKVITEIIDIYSNSTHIGMFVGIEKEGNLLRFGPAGINKSHSYRGILNFTFIKLLEYYGLNNVSKILIDLPEDFEFKKFLTSLGFQTKENLLSLNLIDEKIKTSFLSVLEKDPVLIASQVGQIQNIIELNLDEIKEDKIKSMVDSIVNKIKNMDPLGKVFWDNRKIAQLNYYLSTALIFANELEKEEFLDMFIKTTISSFETHLRDPYLEDMFLALDGKGIFSMPFVQTMIDKIRDIMKKEIKSLDKEELRKWVYINMPTWKLNDQIVSETRKKIVLDAQLILNDFGGNIKENLLKIIQSLIDHYNGTNIFFGMINKF